MPRVDIYWWRKYQARKRGRELLLGAQKLLRMHRDILEPRQVNGLKGLCADLSLALAENRPHLIVELSGKLEKELARAFPERSGSGWRENIEVLLVAAIVAMAIRSFFIQPFKIPTGSMQPTLYGLYPVENYNPRTPFPQRVADTLFLGKWPTDQHAPLLRGALNYLGWLIFGTWPGDGKCIMRGDHIFVDRFTYHFRRPQRGDVIVFETNEVKDLPESYRNKFYIKRLIGIGGDKIQINPPHVLVNGSILDSRPAFRRIYSCQNGYNGYVIPDFPPAKYFRTPTDVYTVPPDEFFVLGDNSRSSLDGRFWGSFPRRSLIGRAIVVYWPFSERFGLIN